jgi:hypothetical protein
MLSSRYRVTRQETSIFDDTAVPGSNPDKKITCQETSAVPGSNPDKKITCQETSIFDDTAVPGSNPDKKMYNQ